MGRIGTLDRWFRLAENGTRVRTEVAAGITTFLTMAYIIFVQPAVLSGAMFGMKTGMDFGAVMTATCLSAAAATLIMAFWARYPIALAPGMGENFFFVFSVIPAAAAAGYAAPWQVALGVVLVSGILFFLLYVLGIRERLFDAISPSLKSAIAAGIGLFIAFIGLQNTGLIVKDPGTAVRLNPHFASPDVLVFLIGLLVAAVLHARRVRGAILWGIVAATVVAVTLKVAVAHSAALAAAPLVKSSMLATRFNLAHGIVAAPPSIAPTFWKFDLAHALTPAMAPYIFIVLYMTVFDTIGTLIGVGQAAGFVKEGKLPRARQAMLADQVGVLLGAVGGTSTVTCYIESAAGVQQGGRTGLTAVVVALGFLLALFFSPVVAMIGSYAPITAPALVLVGALMMGNVRQIAWDDPSEVVPAFLVVSGIPLAYSIADGLALGFISYPIVKACSGRGREVGWLMYILAGVLLAYFLWVRASV